MHLSCRRPTDSQSLVVQISIEHAVLPHLAEAHRSTHFHACAYAQVDFTLAASKLRTAEAASQRDKYRDGSGAAAELRRKLATSLETAASVANGVTQEVMADVDRLEDERGTMLVPQVSALVGCQVTSILDECDACRNSCQKKLETKRTIDSSAKYVRRRRYGPNEWSCLLFAERTVV